MSTEARADAAPLDGADRTDDVPGAGVRPADGDPVIAEGELVVLFDGVCNLCNRAVAFIIDHDRAGRFLFAPLGSDVGRALLTRAGATSGDALTDGAKGPDVASIGVASSGTASSSAATGNIPASIVLIEEGRAYQRSEAVLRIARRMDAPWPLLYALRVVPRRVSDRLYDWIARNRYRWFGTSDVCRLPTPEQARRFLG